MTSSTTPSQDDVNVAVYGSFGRVLDEAPVARKRDVFILMAKSGASDVVAFREQTVAGLRHVANESGLVQAVGTAEITRCIDAAFAADASGEYEGLSYTFADACRDADRKHRKPSSPRSVFNDARLPASTITAVEYLLKQNDAAQLDEFLSGRPHSEKQKIIDYIARKKS